MASKRPPRSIVTLAAVTSALLALGATACSEGPDEAAIASARASAEAAYTQSVQSASAAAHPPIPTAAELDQQFKQALDPNLPDDQRVALIQDGAAFRTAIPDLYRAMNDNPGAVYGVVDPVLDNHDGTISATLRLDKDGTGANVRSTVVHFIAKDGHWQISRTDLCGILLIAEYRTSACG
ncbi:hypothetical protein [Skermania piniformis]|uniref:Low molecular weight antigen MTB12-like C-terminal domain-containing protein n=1 Tax=Skermania pinensis TaxID=39122 RepID=A0ABX8SGJ1_9ACTN|nr:hypothetical protein [Skermania piniformis]QXQ15555.1 hypothetical protein KV203_09835 [Skermania piniformis]